MPYQLGWRELKPVMYADMAGADRPAVALQEVAVNALVAEGIGCVRSCDRGSFPYEHLR